MPVTVTVNACVVDGWTLAGAMVAEGATACAAGAMNVSPTRASAAAATTASGRRVRTRKVDRVDILVTPKDAELKFDRPRDRSPRRPSWARPVTNFRNYRGLGRLARIEGSDAFARAGSNPIRPDQFGQQLSSQARAACLPARRPKYDPSASWVPEE